MRLNADSRPNQLAFFFHFRFVDCVFHLYFIIGYTFLFDVNNMILFISFKGETDIFLQHT